MLTFSSAPPGRAEVAARLGGGRRHQDDDNTSIANADNTNNTNNTNNANNANDTNNANKTNNANNVNSTNHATTTTTTTNANHTTTKHDDDGNTRDAVRTKIGVGPADWTKLFALEARLLNITMVLRLGRVAALLFFFFF